jgi:tRNA-2-methylthio-N6-dimethylallyladenosine synthase
VPGLARIRLNSIEPGYLSDALIDRVAASPRLCRHFHVPLQSGDPGILRRMGRRYSPEQYSERIERIAARVPGCAIGADVMVGFPGEGEAQFMQTYQVLSDLKLDVAHLARYSPRPGTVAERRMPDDVPEEEKMRRFRLLEDLQEKIVDQINARYLGQTVDVLFEEKVKGRWKGRTPTNKLVFVESDRDLFGKILPVSVTWTGPWSMQARV